MKQVIIVRTDLKLPKGKMAAQVAHASLEAVMRSSKDKVRLWQLHGAKKVVLKAADEKELLDLQRKAKLEGLVAAIITDAGLTVVEAGTMTCLGIGPDKEELVDRVTGHLKMM